MMKIPASELRDAVIDVLEEQVVSKNSLIKVASCYLKQMALSANDGFVLSVEALAPTFELKHLFTESDIEEINILINSCIESLSKIKGRNEEEAKKAIESLQELWK